MQEVLLGIDIGTSACKIAAFHTDGTVLAQAGAGYTVQYPRQGWAEQDPEDWWQAVCRAMQEIWEAGVRPADVCGIGIDGQSWSAVPVDGTGQVLCNTPLWMDTRSVDICEEMCRQVGEETLFRTSGNPVQPMYAMPKVLWYQKNLPDVYKRIHKVLQSNGFIAYRLTGSLSQDISQGYGWNCFDIASCRWDEAICRELGVDPAILPELVACHQVVGTVTEEAARQTGLCPGTPVVAGGLDAACGTLGVGVIDVGQTQEQGGQAGGMSICTDHSVPDRRLILSTHVVPGRWLLQGGTVGGSGCLKWFAQEFGAADQEAARQQGLNVFEALSSAVDGIPAGAEGLRFLPYMSGERSPIWDPKAKGVFYGVDFSKTRAHFARAVMEGVALSLRHNLEVAAEAGAAVDIMYAMGGAANSEVWTQIKADVTGKRILVPSADTATALGAAILAGVGTGAYADFSQAVTATVHTRRTHEPNPANRAVYDRAYEDYLNLYNNLKSQMKEA